MFKIRENADAIAEIVRKMTQVDEDKKSFRIYVSVRQILQKYNYEIRLNFVLQVQCMFNFSSPLMSEVNRTSWNYRDLQIAVQAQILSCLITAST